MSADEWSELRGAADDAVRIDDGRGNTALNPIERAHYLAYGAAAVAFLVYGSD